MPDPKRILVVDDHPVVRQGLLDLIGNEPDLEVCGEAQDVPTALEAISRDRPDLVILDLSLRLGDAIDLIERVRTDHPDVSVLVLTMHDESFIAEKALRAGAMGYVTKREASGNVLMAVRSLLNGEMYISEMLSAKLLRRMVSGTAAGSELPARLSQRELQVLELIGLGQGTRDIARTLGLSAKTVENYRSHIKDKLDLRDSRELIQYAIQWVLDRDEPPHR